MSSIHSFVIQHVFRLGGGDKCALILFEWIAFEGKGADSTKHFCNSRSNQRRICNLECTDHISFPHTLVINNIYCMIIEMFFSLIQLLYVT